MCLLAIFYNQCRPCDGKGSQKGFPFLPITLLHQGWFPPSGRVRVLFVTQLSDTRDSVLAPAAKPKASSTTCVKQMTTFGKENYCIKQRAAHPTDMSSFDFVFDPEIHNLRNENDERLICRGNEIMTSCIDVSEPNTGTFNDLPFYLELRNQPECIRVDMVRVVVRRNNFILGIKSVYRCTWRDGTTMEREAPFHDFETGPFAGNDAGTPTVMIFALRPDEFLVDVETRQGEILDALVFVTNRGMTYIGGFGGFDERPARETRSDRSNRHIVAFAGTYRGVMHRIGYYDVDHTKQTKVALMMLRRLCEQGRATPQVQTESLFNWIMQTLFGRARPGLQSDRIIQHLVAYKFRDGEARVPEDIFRKILEYL